MSINCTKEEFDKLKSTDLLPVNCDSCSKEYFIIKHNFHPTISNSCSSICRVPLLKKSEGVICLNCQSSFLKRASQRKKTPNHFCSKSCSATYNNNHKKFGIRRSKLEIYIENQLTLSYPNLEIHFNRKDTIGSELDIYIPELNLAIELNGLFHYEPIFGIDKLEKIENNDQLKFKACINNKINLCIIDTSGQKRFTIQSSKKYLDIITNIIST